MRTDGVIFADFVECRGHLHVQWSCPDCGRNGLVGCDELGATRTHFQITCEVPGENFSSFHASFQSAKLRRAIAQPPNTCKCRRSPWSLEFS